FFSSRRRHTRSKRDWSSDVCSSDLSVVSQSACTSASELTKIALLTSLYVVVTIMLAPISFGAIQLRSAEMFNFLALYNKRYVIEIGRASCRERVERFERVEQVK